MSAEIKKEEMLSKSMEALIDELFTESSAPAEEAVEKAMNAKQEIAGAPLTKKEEKDPNKKPAKTADEGIEGTPDSEEDEKAGKKRGRSKDLSQVSMRDKDGESKGSYDASITEDAKTPAEGNTVSTTGGSGKMKKSFEVSEEEFEMLQKAKKDKEAEELRKAKEEQATLLKGLVDEATKPLREENETLKKSLSEMKDLIKSIAKKPREQKSISSVAVMEKSFGGTNVEGAPQKEAFSKSEMLDVAEELVKSKKLDVNDVIELEDTGYIYNPTKRAILEAELKKRG